MSNWLLEVTDLKQYTCCPRIVFYRYCLPKVRPVTLLMEEGILHHMEEENREGRRSLRSYGQVDGERFFHLALQSEQLGLTGRVDLAIAVPSLRAPNAEAIVVEYKLSEQKVGPHFALQLAAYAMLVEEAWKLPVKTAFLYSISLRRAEPIPITTHLRKKVAQTVTHIRQIVDSEIMPPPPNSQRRCVTCEFRRFCNDVV
jgi:CRISPR-associated exonuclease Cas4